LDTIRFSIKSFGRKLLLIIFSSILLLTTALSEVAPSQVSESDKQKIVRQVAQKWIEVGMEQYRRGYYKAAEQSFLRAQDYEEYLAATEREKLNELLGKTRASASERRRILEHIRAADELEKQGELIKAKTHLENVRDSEFLTEEERKLIAEGLAEINNKLDEQKRQIAELYGRSVELYRTGQLEEARKGFLEVAKSGLLTVPEGETAEDYLAKINGVLLQRVKPSVSIEAKPEEELPGPDAAAIEEPQPDEAALETLEDELLGVEVEPSEEEEPVAVVPPEPVTEEGGYIEVINRRRNILRSHTKAVVSDAVAKAQNYVSQGEFSKAKEAVEIAERTVSKNQLHMGDELFEQYIAELRQLAEKIVQGRNEMAQQLQEQRRLEAIEAQRRYREQMEVDRSKRIIELMDNAMAYQKQQRYEEALGQLESLLAIDPLNDRALILRDTLNDMISFRKQLELQKESSRERLGILLETEKSMIPYAKELTHPKNWREIVASPFRKPEEAIGQDPADAAVFRQLDEIVDLSELTAETPLSDAIEELKNSVEPPLKIVVLWRDLLDNADIDQATPINMDAISAVPLRRVLELLLESVVSAVYAELDYVVEGGVIKIATVEALGPKLITLVYDVTDLLGRPAEYYAQSGGDVSVSGGAETAGGEGFQEEEEITREELLSMGTARAESLVMLIQQTIEPDSWYDVGGEGSITIYENKKLIVYQSREVHNEIGSLLKDLRKALGHQVSIESRFLLVGENFLEDIGLDVDFRYNLGGKWGFIEFQQDSATATLPTTTGITGSLSGFDPESGMPFNLATTVEAGAILTDLQVHFLLRATQGHRDAMSLTAPKVSVVSGESATMRVQRVIRYPREVEIDIDEIGDFGAFRYNVDYEEAVIVTGTILNITPTIMHDKKNVLLNITTELRDFLGMTPNTIQLPVVGGPGYEGPGSYSVPLPETEISRVETRVSVPDGGTLLLGGQKVSVEVEREVGVPILSKIPVIGRLFANRSEVRDEKILLILVKPVIILQEEAEAEAIAAVEDGF